MAYPHTFATQTGSIPLSDLDDNFAAAVNITSGTGSALLPKGTTAQRDTSPTQGGTRFNTTTGALEFYDGTAWQSSVVTSEFGNVQTASGYQDFPQGTIFQWGSFNTTSGAYATWTFPKAFPTGLLQVVGIAQSTSSTLGAVLWDVTASSKTGASVAISTSNNTLIAGTASLLAIGY